METLETNFIFSDQPKHRISRHLIFWFAWWVFFTIVYGSKPVANGFGDFFIYKVSVSVAAVEALIFLPTHIIFSYIILYLLIPRYLLPGKYLSFMAGLILATFFTASLSHMLSIWVVTPFRTSLGVPVPYSNFYFGLMAGLRGGVQTGGFAATIKLLKHFYLKQKANQQLSQEKLKAELQLLKSQVHPHFLFNTLNNLYSLTLTRSEQAPEIVLKLSGLLRYMLYECNTPKVLLRKELDLLLSYIELEKIRYGERLDIAVNIAGEMENKLIAPLLLLPYIENSFKHGTSQQLDQAWINLDIQVKGDKLKFKLINSKTDQQLPCDPENNRSAGIGLENVQKRLNLIYPGLYDLKIVSEEETFMVILTIELEAENTALALANSKLENPIIADPNFTENYENPLPVSR